MTRAIMDIENHETFLNAFRGHANLFLGAGFSVQARDADGIGLPLGRQLASELRNEFALRQLANLDLPKLCTVIASTQRERLYAYLRRRFSVATFDAAYEVVERLPSIDAIFTTNIDNLIHRLYENSVDRYINDLDFEGPVFKDRHAVDLVMLHGSVLHDRRPLRFGTIDIASSFATDPDRWRYLQLRLKRTPTLFWGYSLEDSGTLEALAPFTTGTGGATDTWILVHPSEAAEGVVEYYRALKFQIIVGDTRELLDFLRVEIAEREPILTVEAHDTRGLFPSEHVPLPGEGPGRPITEFYKGAAPMWSDIYAGLFRTSHYRTIREAINSRKDVIITGVPASGKTTLLMQLAADLNYPGHKLITDKFTRARGEFLVRKLGEQRAIVFIDNCTDDVSALSLLVEANNIQVLGCDRDYNLSSVVHQIPRERFTIVDVTDLTDQDLQGVRSHIPDAIRSPEFIYPQLAPGLSPSLFEFVEANTLEPTLRARLIEAIGELRRASPDTAETLLVVAYVHSCRTPISMDMALAYWYDSALHYEEIYEMVQGVGRLITDYEGDLADEPQDYFCARSTIVAETVLGATDDKALRRMLTRFHENVSVFRICHYRIFQRKAYDAALFGRVFGDWQDGAAFYDKLFERDPSPYLLQQEALYLRSKKQYMKAFELIDRALAKAGPTNWTIKNSHAIIMFRANIAFADDPAARATLDESMEILRKCYTWDRRKAFHAMVFADHATKYWDAYSDDQARRYLMQAAAWLTAEKRNEPWLKRIEPLQRLIDRRLR